VVVGADRDGEALALIDRPRLLARCADAPVVVLEAPGGFGKSSLAEQLARDAAATVRVFLSAGDSSATRLASRLRDACRVSGLPAAVEAGIDLEDAADELAAIADALVRAVREDGWLIVEDAQVLDAEALGALAAVCEDLVPEWRVVITGRVVAHQMPGELHLGADDLLFTNDDTNTLIAQTMVADDDLAGAITRECGGWPAAIGLAIAAQVRTPTAHNAPTNLDSLVAGLLSSAEQLDARTIAALGHLPVVSDAIGEALGISNLIASVTASGLPIRSTGRWWRLADPVRQHLASYGPLDAGDLVDALGVIFAAGETTLAIDMLLEARRPADVCRLIAEMPYAMLDQIDVDEMASLLTAVPALVVATNPRCLAKLARAAEGRVRIELRTRLLKRLEAIVHVVDDPVIARELEAELVFDLNRDSKVEETERRGRALLAATPPDEIVTRARCLHALGRITAWRGDDRSLVDASHLLAEAAGAMRAIGNDHGVADVLCTLGFFVLMPRGDFELGVARLREGTELLPARSRRRAVQLTFLAESFALLGRDDEAVAALSESRSIGRAHADERILGYAAWTQAKVVARRRDIEGTLRWLREAERNPGDWLDHPTGTQFLAEAAEIAAMVGAEQIATDYLARSIAQAEAQGWPEIPEAARGSLAARFGDATLAEELLTLERVDAYRNASNRWRASLLVAHARARRGDVAGARSKAAAVVEELETLGHPEFAMLHEPEIWSSLVRILDGETTPTVAVTLLGGFRIEVDGAEIALPTGRPAQVVKLLALAGRPLPVDELAETLWPHTAADVGRRRLRNVLARVRSAAPILDRNEGVIALVPTAVVDSHLFERLAQLASTAPIGERLGAAESALARYTGELLPADRFEDWSVAPRERLQRRAIRLLTAIIDAAVEGRDVDRVVHTTEQLLALDPFDDSVARRLAVLLRDSGRTAEALQWAKRCAAIRGELGLAVPGDPMKLLDLDN
jgi:DNA-binding SARP family transcriptional activator